MEDKIQLKITFLDGKTHNVSLEESDLNKVDGHYYYDASFKLYGLKRFFRFEFNEYEGVLSNLVNGYISDKKGEWHPMKGSIRAYVPSFAKFMSEKMKEAQQDKPEEGEAAPIVPEVVN